MHDHHDLEPVCVFCGQDAGHGHIMLGAFWDEDHGVSHEHWPAHGRCLLERMSDLARSHRGPFLEAVARGKSPVRGGDGDG